MIHNDSKNLYKNIINGISKNILKCINEAQIDLLFPLIFIGFFIFKNTA